MPPKGAQDASTIPEAQGLKYDESDMALFHAKLLYHSTIDERMASQDSNLASIAEAQAKILKRWELLKQSEKDLAAHGKSLPATDKRQLAQYEWMFNQHEKRATETSGG